MSKVIKNSGDFIPKNIVSEDFDQTPVWGDIARRIEPDDTAQLPNSTAQSAYTPGEISHEEIEKSKQHPFDSDFSAPEINDNQTDDLTSNLTADNHNQPGSIQYTQEEIDALTDDAFNRGIQAGFERCESDYGLSVKTLQSTCEQLNTIRETILKNSMAEMRELVLLISEKIIRHSVASQKETIISTVEDAIHQAVKSDEFVISVNPDDYDIIQSRSADFLNSISGLENIRVHADTSVEVGGCVIESSNCTVDATLAGQLEIIAESLQE